MCTKFHENISKDFRVIKRTCFPLRNFQRGVSRKNAGGVNIPLLCTLSDNALFVPSFVKISRRASELLSGHDFYTEIFEEARIFRKFRCFLHIV